MRVLRSSSTVVFGMILKFSTSTFSTFGETNAGSLGPSIMFLTPRLSSASRTRHAFCSYHAILYATGRSLISSTPKASARACAMTTSE